MNFLLLLLQVSAVCTNLACRLSAVACLENVASDVALADAVGLECTARNVYLLTCYIADIY